MALIVFIGFCFLIYFIVKTYNNSDYAKEKQIEKNKQTIEYFKQLQDEMNKKGFYPTYAIYEGKMSVYFDENNKKICVPIFNYQHRVIDIDKITKYEIITTNSNNIQYTFGTPLTGKLKQNTVIKNVGVRLYLNEIDTPYITIPCMGSSIGISFDYVAISLSSKIVGALDYIKNNKQKKKKPTINIIPNLNVGKNEENNSEEKEEENKE